MLNFVVEEVKNIEDICLYYNVSIFFVFGFKIGNSLKPSVIELIPEKYNNPTLLAATDYTLRSVDGLKIVFMDILCQKDKDDKKFNDPITKGRRIGGKIEEVKKELTSFSERNCCVIVVTNGEENFNSDKKKEMLKKLGEIIETLENCDVKFVH